MFSETTDPSFFIESTTNNVIEYSSNVITTYVDHTSDHTSDHTGFISSYSVQNTNTETVYFGNQTKNGTTSNLLEDENSNLALIVSLSVISFFLISVIGVILFKKNINQHIMNIFRFKINDKIKENNIEMI